MNVKEFVLIVVLNNDIFLGSNLSCQGERLSHAVGCAFAACLERKQRREKECGVTASFDASRTSFVREGSFRINSSYSQQTSSSEETMQIKKKGRRVFQMLTSDD